MFQTVVLIKVIQVKNKHKNLHFSLGVMNKVKNLILVLVIFFKEKI